MLSFQIVSATLRCALLLVLCLTASARAIPAGSFTLDMTAGYVRALGRNDADIGAINIGGNYFLFENISLGGEIGGYGISQPGDDATAVGLSTVLRIHLFEWKSGGLFIDGSFGPVESSVDVPEGGTHFNFISRAGAGATIRLDERLHLILGARYWHLSNAQIQGYDRNPTINGVEGYVGLMWQL